MLKLLALDIDNTLTDDNGIVSSTGIAAVRQAQSRGIQVILISARPPQGVDIIAQQLNEEVYRVCYVGAVIQDSNCKDIQRLLLDIDIARDIARFADIHKISLTITIDDKEYHTQHETRESLTPQLTVGSAESTLTTDTQPILIGAGGHYAASLVDQYVTDHHNNSVLLTRHFNNDGTYSNVLITHPNSKKGDALLTLCHILSIDSREILAIGDSENDLSMFEVAGMSVAVANAIPSVCSAASLVAPLPYGDGVKWAINQLLQI